MIRSSVLLFIIFIQLISLISHNGDQIELVSNLQQANSLDVSTGNIIYITERGKNRLLKVDDKGVKVDSIGNQGFGDYQFDGIRDVDATNGLKIFVSDLNNQRIQLYDRRLQYLSSITASAVPGRRTFSPSLISENSMRELFVFDERRFSILKFDENSNFELDIDLRQFDIRSVDALLATDDNMFILDRRDGILHYFNSVGQYTGFWSGFDKTYAITNTGKHLIVADHDKVRLLNNRGRLVSEVNISSISNISDVAWLNNNLYILTNSSLFKKQFIIP